MPENSSTPWPTDLFDFAFIPAIDEKLQELSNLAEDEDWNYHNSPSDHPFPILYNYVRYTYRRIAEETKISLSEDGQFSCFNTGLVTDNQEPLYGSFQTNRIGGKQPWFFKAWL